MGNEGIPTGIVVMVASVLGVAMLFAGIVVAVVLVVGGPATVSP